MPGILGHQALSCEENRGPGMTPRCRRGSLGKSKYIHLEKSRTPRLRTPPAASAPCGYLNATLLACTPPDNPGHDSRTSRSGPVGIDRSNATFLLELHCPIARAQRRGGISEWPFFGHLRIAGIPPGSPIRQDVDALQQ